MLSFSNINCTQINISLLNYFYFTNYIKNLLIHLCTLSINQLASEQHHSYFLHFNRAGNFLGRDDFPRTLILSIS